MTSNFFSRMHQSTKRTNFSCLLQNIFVEMYLPLCPSVKSCSVEHKQKLLNKPWILVPCGCSRRCRRRGWSRRGRNQPRANPGCSCSRIPCLCSFPRSGKKTRHIVSLHFCFSLSPGKKLVTKDLTELYFVWCVQLVAFQSREKKSPGSNNSETEPEVSLFGPLFLTVDTCKTRHPSTLGQWKNLLDPGSSHDEGIPPRWSVRSPDIRIRGRRRCQPQWTTLQTDLKKKPMKCMKDVSSAKQPVSRQKKLNSHFEAALRFETQEKPFLWRQK